MERHNFYAGPSILSGYTIKNTAAVVENFASMGLLLLEISHRSREFVAVNGEACVLAKELLDVSASYEVVFMSGGASTQFCTAPYNLLSRKASYLDTDTWASNAIKEAKLFREVDVVVSSKGKNYTCTPKGCATTDGSGYFHSTPNNMTYGTGMRKGPDVKQCLVCDMFPDIFPRPVDIPKYDTTYTGVQRNLASAGVTLVTVRVDALGHVNRPILITLSYATHIKKDFMFSAPPVLPIYTALQTLKWHKEQGGIAAMEKKDLEGAVILYDETNHNKLPRGTAAEGDRSIINVCSVTSGEYKESENGFSRYAIATGVVGIKGYRSVGGFHASLHSVMPRSSMEALVVCMKGFEKQH